MKTALLFFFVLCLFSGISLSQTNWQADLDSNVRFYHTTDFGIVIAGTEKSLYAIDGRTGERIWRKATGKVDETSVTPVPDTDVILFTKDEGSKSRLEAVDLLTGARIWQSDKVKGDVMQLAVDPENDLIAVVLVKEARRCSGDTFKRKPVVHVLQLSTGDELWKRDFDNEIEMMPSRFGEGIGDIDYTLDNYRAPLILDGRLFLFYEGSTSYDARSGKEKEREKFKINEDGLALTEADPVFDDTHVFVSGRGRVRAINRRTGKQDWKADDLGISAEMGVLVGNVLFVRTGGQFTQLKNGELKEKGPNGVSAIDTANGKTLWRYKGADKGLTNFVFADADTILIADRDDLMAIDVRSGKRITKRDHKIEKAQFVLVNERGQAVVGGSEEIAAFPIGDQKAPEAWRVRHKAPGRGAFRVIAGIALRAAALYFRYGGIATTGIGLARTGAQLRRGGQFISAGPALRLVLVRSISRRLRATRHAATSQGVSIRTVHSAGPPGLIDRFSGLQISTPANVRGRIIGAGIDRATPSRSDVQESIFDRLDPARQLDKFSDYLLRRKRLAELRANHMYFYTDLGKPYDRKGLVGVNVHTGIDSRFVLLSDPDPMFVTDDTTGLLYSVNGNKLRAFNVLSM